MKKHSFYRVKVAVLQCEVCKNEEKEPFLKFQEKATSCISRFKYPLRRCPPLCGTCVHRQRYRRLDASFLKSAKMAL